eukprot:TRINITY_DN18328_c0_g1_i1.p1 TRINITY_DN18328_c0_g1~~TRINITY_DN18328_c0_g1_i1.p1  ORF type:complete len:109 (+),score=13.49 TRINITY_DN18328_c0_g1_i1:181-507(+)
MFFHLCFSCGCPHIGQFSLVLDQGLATFFTLFSFSQVTFFSRIFFVGFTILFSFNTGIVLSETCILEMEVLSFSLPGFIIFAVFSCLLLNRRLFSTTGSHVLCVDTTA